MKTKVDFAYSFAAPHRVTAALPVASEKTLLDITPESLTFSWIYDDLRRMPKSMIMMLPGNGLNWNLDFKMCVNDAPVTFQEWSRLDGWIPSLTANGDGVRIVALATPRGLVMQVAVANPTAVERRFSCRCAPLCKGGYGGYAPHWIDPEIPADHLLAGWSECATRVLMLGVGMDRMQVESDGGPIHQLQFALTVPPQSERTLWIVRPYEAFAADLPELRACDWAAELKIGAQIWRDRLARAVPVVLPDPRVMDAFRACLADIFVMQEPAIDGLTTTVAGTLCYRAPNTTEGNIANIGLAQFGYFAEAAAGMSLSLQSRNADGDWNDPDGWGHTMWFCSGFKSWCVLQYYHLTGDRAWLERYFVNMLDNSRWQERQRAKTRRLIDGNRPLTYGLMPRGFGDCGLIADGDWYGVFYPHNFFSVLADELTLEAARLLGRHDLLAELTAIYETAKHDLELSLRAGAIEAGDYSWIPCAPGCKTGSRFGALCAAVPCNILSPDDPLISGTLQHMNANLSPGGVHLNTGWLPNGAWVAMELDNIAAAYLARREGGRAAELLYATLNHASPLFTWCEERGGEAGSTTKTGDLQHIWTPVAVVRYLHDALILETADALHLGRGIDRDWLLSGGLKITGAPTRFGRLSYSLSYDPDTCQLTGQVDFPTDDRLHYAELEVRLPAAPRDRLILSWQQPHGRYQIAETVTK